jgi:prepilin signal peptidase PulO-like enzyme (type II secretory pathway)
MVVLYFRDLEIHETFMLCILFFILIASAFTDYLYRIIPNRLLLAGFFVWLIITGLSPYKPVDGLLAGFVIGLFFWIIATFYLRFTGKEALGMGDVKLFFITGLLVGWTGLWLIYLSVFFGALYAAAGILTNRFDRNHRIPVAPFLAAGSFLGIFVIPWGFIMDFLYAL